MQKYVYCVLEEMSDYLSPAQMKRLQEVLLKQFGEARAETQKIERSRPLAGRW